MKRFQIQIIENFGTTWSLGINLFRLDFRAGLAYTSYSLAVSYGRKAIVLSFKHRTGEI